MKYVITIDCESVNELTGHLSELSRQVKKEAKRLKLDPTFQDMPQESAPRLYDNNCYGTHIVEIIKD